MCYLEALIIAILNSLHHEVIGKITIFSINPREPIFNTQSYTTLTTLNITTMTLTQ